MMNYLLFNRFIVSRTLRRWKGKPAMNKMTMNLETNSLGELLFFIFLPVIRLISPLFFATKYLSGKYFENDITGWKWVWRGIIWQKIFGINRHIPWPVSPFIVITKAENIEFHVNDINNFQTFGIYFQNFQGKIVIGEGSYIGQNVGLITANHDLMDPDTHQEGKDIILGKKCWIGMNSVILPGVVLGDHTVVGAGSVVTKSFSEGYSIVAGNPAKIIRKLPE